MQTLPTTHIKIYTLVFMVTANLLCRHSIPWENIVYYGHTLEITIVSFINIVKFWLSTIRFIKFRFHCNMSPYLIYKVCTIWSPLKAGLTVYINLYFSFSYNITIIWKLRIKLQPNSLPDCSEKRVAWSLICSVVFCRSCLSFSFRSLYCLPTTYGFWLPFWCLQHCYASNSTRPLTFHFLLCTYIMYMYVCIKWYSTAKHSDFFVNRLYEFALDIRQGVIFY